MKPDSWGASQRTHRMHRTSGRPAMITACALFFMAPLAGGCHKKASSQQCDELLDRFAELVVKERFPDAGADVIAAERTRERNEAKVADEFKNCTSEVQLSEHACAMKAPTSEAMIKCLE